LIMCSITCLGQTGPLSRHPGHEYIGQAYSGILGSTGDKDGYPSLSGTAFGEISTGAHAFGAIVSALLHRHHGGGGQYLDISLLDCLFSYHAAHVQMYAATEGVVNPPRCGHHHALLSPLGLFSCHGHYVVIVALGRQWENLVKLIGREDMLTDPRFTDLLSCGTNQKFIIDAIENWLASTASFDRALQLLQENHVPCAPVFDIREVMEHPHMIARGIVQTINDRIFGEVKIPASPFKYSLFPEPLNIQAGTLGEHNHEILSNNLNYSTAKINLLEADGICTTGNV
jgi:crotonobetainyl-CoA:carnitine CoA-transferase CaiB-like acyl-CoA transferase